MNPSEPSTSSNWASKIVQVLLFAAGIAWAFLVSKQDLSETQMEISSPCKSTAGQTFLMSDKSNCHHLLLSGVTSI